MNDKKVDIALLKEIQKLDFELGSFEREKQKKRDEYQKIKENYDVIKNEYDSLKNQTLSFDDEIKKIDQANEELKKKIEASRARMFGVKSQREFDALKTEIKTFQHLISENETKQLELMESLDKANEKLPALQEKFDALDKQLTENLTNIDNYMESVSEKFNELNNKKNELLIKLQPRTRQIYTKILSAKTPALAKITETTCSACNIDIPPQTVNEVRKESRIYTCDSCNRILYWED